MQGEHWHCMAADCCCYGYIMAAKYALYLPDTKAQTKRLCLWHNVPAATYALGPVCVYQPVTHLIVLRASNVKYKGLSTVACNIGLEMRLWERNQVVKSVAQ